jgi:hypothetical protein
MIAKEKYKNALYAIHLIIVRGRFMAYTEESHKEIARLLDCAEILPGMLISKDDETEGFTKCIEDIVIKFPSCGYILERYKSNTLPDGWQ